MSKGSGAGTNMSESTNMSRSMKPKLNVAGSARRWSVPLSVAAGVVGAALLSGVFAVPVTQAETRDATAAARNATPTFAAEVELRVPSVDYRTGWVQLGTFSVLADEPEEGAKELHAVYTERANVAHYLKTGRFPDGAVLVKDVFAAQTEELTTGTASFAGELKGRFVMMKDEKTRYSGASARFGDGWGWAFYEGDERNRTVTKDYKADCLGCHEPVRDQALVFTQGYPVLKP